MGRQLHIISSGKQSVEKFVANIAKVHAYVDFIHLRERQWTAQDHLRAVELLCAKGIPLEKLMINDRVDIAHVKKVTGVQLAHHSLPLAMVRKNFPHLKIGCSVQTVEAAIRAESAGAEWLIHGHIFTTASKQGMTPRGLSSLKKIVESVNIPVIAIGGITPNRVRNVIQTGAQGVAVLSGILHADEPEKMAKRYREELDRGGVR